jgi:hypothetical protein
MSKYILTIAYILFLGYAMGLIYNYENTNKILGIAIITYLVGTLINQFEINLEHKDDIRYED